jgi:serine/threonine protein kinase/Flp pilus assembly protein TadD
MQWLYDPQSVRLLNCLGACIAVKDTTLGRYRIVEQIGAGGMGIVYRARDQRLDRDVAIKVLPTGSLAKEGARSRFRKEALALSRLSHPNVAVVHDFDTENDTDFLVMELVPGTTLEEKLLAGPLEQKEALQIITQVLEGLAAAHAQGLIHCDIKPSNLRITPDGRVKILDFGLAKIVRQAEAGAATATLTQDMGIAGTLAYMPPEQLRGEPADPRNDIYAAGCVLYEAVTGHRPFSDTHSPLLVDSILNKSPASPRSWKPQLPASLEYVILKALEKAPIGRYQSAAEMLSDLRQADTATLLVPRPSPLRLKARTAWLALALLLLLCIGGYLGFYILSPHPVIDSIAILPFANLTGGAETEYLSDGITDTLINSISRLPNMKVVSGSSVLRYREKVVDPQTLGRELHVRAVVTGKYAERGNELSVSVELSDTRDNRHIWGEQYRRSLSDIAAVQEEISRQIVDMLRLNLTNEQREAVARTHTTNAEAYQLYLKGRHYLLKDTPEDLQRARMYYEQAIDADPTYAPAYAGLSDYYGYMVYSGEMAPSEAYPKVEAAAVKAAQLDPKLGGAHSALAAAKFFYHWDWAGTENELQRSLELNPNEAEAHGFYSIYLRAMRRFDEALREARRAQELDPLSPSRKSMVALAHYYAGQYDAAEQLYTQLSHTDPDLPGPHLGLFNLYARKGKESDAINEWQKALQLQGADELATALPRLYASSGFQMARETILRQQLRLLIEASKQAYISPLALASTFALLNEKEKALEWLEKAWAEHTPGLTDVGLDPDYESLQSDDRFRNLLRRLKLPT